MNDMYEQGMKSLKNHIQRNQDGTFSLVMSKDEPDIDHDIFNDLIRSLAHTNYLIKEGVINPADIKD